MTIALTMGTWDPVHVDHVLLLRRCDELADIVKVGVNSDRFVREYKGRPPVFNEQERMSQISALGYQAYLNDGPGYQLVKAIMPDFIVVGGDWIQRNYLSQIEVDAEWLQLENISLVFVPYGRTITSSEIRDRCRLT